MRIVDILLSIPSLMLAVSVAAVVGQRPIAIMVAIASAQVPIFARLLRGSMLAQRGQDYVLASTSLGPAPPDHRDEPHPAQLARPGASSRPP